MRTAEHQAHIDARTAHNDCRECRADTERRFVSTAKWQYQHVHDYLAWAQPRIEAIRNGEDSVNARIWLRDFRMALDRRINLKTGTVPKWRKLSNGYQERLNHIRRDNRCGIAYLRNFANVGASALA